MAVPYMFGPGGQPILMGQIPALMQQQQQQQFQQPQTSTKPQARDFMTEEKLQEKGIYIVVFQFK